MNKKTRIVILDDHPLVIEGFKKVIQENHQLELVQQFGRAEALMDFLSKETIDLLLLDINLPDGNGIQICREIKANYPHIRILGISNLSERSIIKQMLLSGAGGYLLKTADAQDILFCIREVLQDRLALSKEVKENFDLKILKDIEEIPQLTRREKQILQLLAQGKQSAEIADMLFISPLTVKTHRATLLQKFNAGTILLAIHRAKEYGLL